MLYAVVHYFRVGCSLSKNVSLVFLVLRDEFHFRLTESEEVIREHLRNLREAETRLSAMEKDNLAMRDKITIISRQNEHLERLNKILEKPEVIRCEASFRSRARGNVTQEP